MYASDRALLLGALPGLLAGSAVGYLTTDKKKSRLKKIRNAILLGLAGGVTGATLGRITNSHIDFVRRRNKSVVPGNQKDPGRVLYVNFPGWRPGGTEFATGHAGMATVDSSGNLHVYNYGNYQTDLLGEDHAELPGDDVDKVTDLNSDRNTKTLMRHLIRDGLNNDYGMRTNLFIPGDFRGKSDKEIAKAIYDNIVGDGGENGDAWSGRRVDVWGADVPDVGVARRYFDTHGGFDISEEGQRIIDNDEGNSFWGRLFGRGLKDKHITSRIDELNKYDIVPGASNCGTVAREAFDAARGGNNSFWHWIDMLIGGTPVMNAPSLGTTRSTYIKGK